MKLACCIDVIDHLYLFSLMCDDQFVNLLQIVQVVLQIFGVFFFLLETLCSSQFCEFELKLNMSLTTLEHAS